MPLNAVGRLHVSIYYELIIVWKVVQWYINIPHLYINYIAVAKNCCSAYCFANDRRGRREFIFLNKNITRFILQIIIIMQIARQRNCAEKHCGQRYDLRMHIVYYNVYV